MLCLLGTAQAQTQEIYLPRTMSPGINRPTTTLQQAINYLNANAPVGDAGEGGLRDRMIVWDNHDQPNGVYMYQATGSGGMISNGKIVVVR